MSDELRLPDELAAIEARLAALPLAGSTIDRDRLMYEAGRAAGAGTARFAVVGSASRRTTILCAAASAALAASLGVVVTLALQPTPAPLIAQSTSEGTPREAMAVGNAAVKQSAVEGASANLPDASRANESGRFPFQFADPRAIPINSALLAFRRGGAEFDLPEFEVSTTSTNAAASSSRTARELLEEFIPRSSAPAFPIMQLWPWPRQADSGDTI